MVQIVDTLCMFYPCVYEYFFIILIAQVLVIFMILNFINYQPEIISKNPNTSIKSVNTHDIGNH